MQNPDSTSTRFLLPLVALVPLLLGALPAEAGKSQLDTFRQGLAKVAGTGKPGKGICHCESGVYEGRLGSIQISEFPHEMGTQVRFEAVCMVQTWSETTGEVASATPCDGAWTKPAK